MEEPYRASLLKAFNKTLTDGFFPMVIVDAINNKVSIIAAQCYFVKRFIFE